MGMAEGSRNSDRGSRRFAAEAAYAESIFQQAQGDVAGAIAAAELALEHDPTYAPAVLTVGSIEYQRGNDAVGRRLLLSLTALVDEGDLCVVLDEAGDFLIGEGRYEDGLEFYRAATARYPDDVALLQGLCCTADHAGAFELALAAATSAVRLEPHRSALRSDLGWSLFRAGRLREAEAELQLALDLDEDNELAEENLRVCRDALAVEDAG